jgi:hypothetical protein
MPTLTSAYPTPCGIGGVDGDEAEVEVAGLAGGVLRPIGTRGGRARN